MNYEELRTALYEKIAAEQNKFRDRLLTQPAEEILNNAYTYTTREDIVMEMECLKLSPEQINALLASESTLEDLFKAYRDMEDWHMEDIRFCIEDRADRIIEMERDKLLSTPVYLQSGAHARENNELEVFCASYKANIACKEALEEAIQNNYNDNYLNTDAIYNDVVGKFGAERVKHVLATTVQHKDWDQRFSHGNRAWAQTVPMEASFGARDNDHSVYYVVDKDNSCLTDAFVTHFRKEQSKELTQPNKDSILKKLQKPLPEQTKAAKEKTHER